MGVNLIYTDSSFASIGYYKTMVTSQASSTATKLLPHPFAPFLFAFVFEHVGIYPSMILLGFLSLCGTMLLLVLYKKRF